MTTIAERVPCPVEGCGYTMDSPGSVAAHVAMAHPEVPMDDVAPKRSARNEPTTSAAAPEPRFPDGSAPTGTRARRATPGPVPAAGGPSIVELPLDLIDVGHNVRINVAELEDLAASIREHGVLQPIKVTGPHDDGRYLVTWGQRRTLASRMAEQVTIPAIVLPPTADVDADGATRSIEQLVENLHRADLAPLDRARAIRDVVSSGTSQADLARKLGIAPSTVANDLGLLEAPEGIQKMLEAGQLTPAHAKAMKGLAPKTQVELAKEVVQYGYSAHRTEEEVQRRKRMAESQAERERQDKARLEQDRERLEESIATLAAKKKPGLDVDLVVYQDYYGQGDVKVRELAAMLRKAGFTNVREATSRDQAAPRPKGCTCTAWKATLHSSYQHSAGGYVTRLQATPACIVAGHVRAKTAADDAARRERYNLEQMVQARLKELAPGLAHVPPMGASVVAVGLEVQLARMALWVALDYQVGDFARARGLKPSEGWKAIEDLTAEALAEELAKAIAAKFRDQFGYHVPWAELAAELGIDAAPQGDAAKSAGSAS